MMFRAPLSRLQKSSFEKLERPKCSMNRCLEDFWQASGLRWRLQIYLHVEFTGSQLNIPLGRLIVRGL